jgi:hypothetical protein
MTERSVILEMLARLKLSGIRAAYDEVVTMSIKRQHGVERVIHQREFASQSMARPFRQRG